MDKGLMVSALVNNYTKGNKSQFANMLGITPQTVSAWINRKSFDAELIFSKCKGISAEWLLTGNGDMQIGNNPETNSIKNNSSVLVPVVPTEAQAGHLSDFSDSVHEYDCEMMISPVKDATLAMGVYGDSMSPGYPSGCRVLLKKVNENAFIEWGKVYVLDTENGAVIKEIHHCDDEDYIECVSQNPDPKYAPFKIPKESVFGWYKVIMVLSFK